MRAQKRRTRNTSPFRVCFGKRTQTFLAPSPTLDWACGGVIKEMYAQLEVSNEIYWVGKMKNYVHKKDAPETLRPSVFVLVSKPKPF